MILCYFLYGLFYSGKMFDSICNYIIDDKIDVDGADTINIAVLTILCIVFYPFVLGVKSLNNN